MKTRFIGGVFLAAAVPFLVPASAFATGLNGDTRYTDGPEVCGKCHAEQYDDWLAHGHSRKIGAGFELEPLVGRFGLPVEARDEGIPLPKHDHDVYNWDNVLFVVGTSKHWKTRFVGKNGYLITKNGKNQYNWQDGSWSDYHRNQVKPFTCGTCHNTGFRKSGEAFKKGFPGTKSGPLPGVKGDWAHFNVTCEACHGPGAAHAAAPQKVKIAIDTSAKACGACHVRGKDSKKIVAGGGFIHHHEQYPELLNSPHKALPCTTCHEPHVTRAMGVKVLPGKKEVCDTCHAQQRAEYTGSAMAKAGVRCQDCHMARTGKSAIKNGPFEGDVWGHIMRINTAADYTMFTADDKFAKDAISLEYACMRCHADADKKNLSKIKNFHTIGK